jgi:hypothetical protein
MLLVVIYGSVCFAVGALTAPVWPWLLRRGRRILRRGRRSAWANYMDEGRNDHGPAASGKP